MKTKFAIALLFAINAASLLPQTIPGHEFSEIIASNELFGRKLLSELHAAAPDKNVVISPLPVSFAFAPLTEAIVDSETLGQINSAFEWRDIAMNRGAARLLSAAFKQPPPARPRPHPQVSKLTWQLMNQESPEKLWISTLFTYRGRDALSPRFVDMGARYFGLKFKSLPWNSTQRPSSLLDDSSAATPESPKGRNDFWITSTTHLRTAWADNTFALGKRVNGDFFPKPGQPESVPMLISELNAYSHQKTQAFESVVFVARSAYIQVVLPSEEVSLQDLESKLVRDPSLLDPPPNRELGYIEIPKFNFEFKADVRGALEKMGVNSVFTTNLALAELVSGDKGALLNDVSQKTNIEFNELGIRADAETVTNGVYCGIMGDQPNPFHMLVNRPFLFFIRDNLTNSLLFAGAVMDPLKH
jgi:serine protease inhibitor